MRHRSVMWLLFFILISITTIAIVSPQITHAAENDTSDGCPQGQIRGGGGGTTTPNRNKCYSKAGQSGGVPNYHEEGDVDESLIPGNGGNENPAGTNPDCGEGKLCEDLSKLKPNDEPVPSSCQVAEANNSADKPSVANNVGWIICPVSNLVANLSDQFFRILSDFLRYDSLTSENGAPAGQRSQCGNSKPLECGWSQARNLANIVFVIMFIIIVYSQITGIGFTNYNIKKMLPRLIVASILVNISYWVCALMVDLSNVIGSNIYEFLVHAGAAANQSNAQTLRGSGILDPDQPFTPQYSYSMSGVLAGAAAGGAATLITGSGGVLGTLSFLLPIVLGALLAAFTVVMILIARQAIITLLIIISPLAFVMMLLPNTNKWFERWKDLFISMLILYPLVGFVFGGATFAAFIVQLADQDVFATLFALAVQSIPLFIIPMVLKTTGGLLGKIGAISNDKSKGLFDRANNSGQAAIENRANRKAAGQLNRAAKNPSGWGGIKAHARMGARAQKIVKDQENKQADRALGIAQSGYNRNRYNDPATASRAAGGDAAGIARLQGNIQKAERKEEEAVVAGLASGLAAHSGPDLLAELNSMDDPTTPLYAAYISELMARGTDIDDYKDHVDAAMKAGSSTGGNITTRTVANGLKGSAIVSASGAHALASGRAGNSFSSFAANQITTNGISGASIGSANSRDMNLLQHIHSQGGDAAHSIKKASNAVLDSPKHSGDIKAGNMEAVKRFAGRP